MKREPRLTGKDRRKRSAAPVDLDTGDEYRVGPGRPPKEFQFKPGQSGNPKGASRKGPSIVPDLKAALERELSKKVTLRQGEKEQIVTMATAGMEHLVAQFAKGDRHARRDVFDLAEKLGVDITAGQRKAVESAQTDLSADDEALLADYLHRHGTQRGRRGQHRSSPASKALRRKPGEK
jgi:hypothetical protein